MKQNRLLVSSRSRGPFLHQGFLRRKHIQIAGRRPYRSRSYRNVYPRKSRLGPTCLRLTIRVFSRLSSNPIHCSSFDSMKSRSAVDPGSAPRPQSHRHSAPACALAHCAGPSGSMKHLVEPVQVDVRQQAARSLLLAAYRFCSGSPSAVLHPSCCSTPAFPATSGSASTLSGLQPAWHTRHQLPVRNRIEVPFQVRIVDSLIARLQMRPYFFQGIMGRSPVRNP